jgi:cytochrome c-type biogenesis protein CcmH
LFVFVRSPDGGPPLAVKRSGVRLPQDVDLSAADAMVAGRAVQPGQSVSVVARISASGSALPQSGDLFGEIHYVAGQSGPQGLEIDRRTP